MFTRSSVPASLVVLCLVTCLAVTGCKGEKGRIADAYEAAATGGRAAAANLLRSEWAKGHITFSEAIRHGLSQLESGDAAAVAFAGGVLDALLVLDPSLHDPEMGAAPTKSETLDWTSVGALAFRAGEKSASRGEFALAGTLVLGGTTMWQDEAYWAANDAHDALASTVLHKCGKSQEAIDRLKSRPQLGEKSQEALDTIEREWRKARGG